MKKMDFNTSEKIRNLINKINTEGINIVRVLLPEEGHGYSAIIFFSHEVYQVTDFVMIYKGEDKTNLRSFTVEKDEKAKSHEDFKNWIERRDYISYTICLDKNLLSVIDESKNIVICNNFDGYYLFAFKYLEGIYDKKEKYAILVVNLCEDNTLDNAIFTAVKPGVYKVIKKIADLLGENKNDDE